MLGCCTQVSMSIRFVTMFHPHATLLVPMLTTVTSHPGRVSKAEAIGYRRRPELLLGV